MYKNKSQINVENKWLIYTNLIKAYGNIDLYIVRIPSPPFIQEKLSKLLQKKEGVDFSHKKRGLGKIGNLFKKGGYHLFSY